MAEPIVVSRKVGRGVLAATGIASAALVVSLVTSTYLLSRAYVLRGEQPDLHSRTLEVTGSAKTRVTSDLALWDIRIAGSGTTVQDAFGKLAEATDAVHQFLAARGFPDDAVTMTAIDTRSHTRTTKHKHGEDETSDEEIVSYELSRRFEIRTPDVMRVARAAGEVTEILKTGAHVESSAPSYVFTGLDELKIHMIGDATANARQRADTIATGSKCRVGAVKDARAGVLQITPPWSTEVSDRGLNDTSSIDKDVTAVVHLTLAIDPTS
jgi:uncharacterized protein